jgi:hypothetical protein
MGSVHAEDPTLKSWDKAPLTSDLEKLRYLVQVREVIPNLFEDSAQHQIELLKILDDQRRALEALKPHQRYHEQLLDRRPLLEIQIDRPKDAPQAETHVAPSAVDYWRAKIRRTAEKIPVQTHSPSEFVLKKISTIQKELSLSPEGLLTGLIQQLPGSELRDQAFRLSTNEAKSTFLRQHLPDPLPGSFAFSKHELSDPGKAAALTRLGNLIAREIAMDRNALEKELREWVQLRIVLQAPDGKLKGSRDRLIELADHLGEAELSALSDFQQELPSRVKGLLKNLEGRIPNTAQSRDRLLRLAKEPILQATRETRTEPGPAASTRLTLREVPPGIGIFRGCAGSDCSTQHSFPYPNHPDERVYFIQDEQGRLKGYASGSLMTSGPDTVFYLHTVAGPNLSRADARTVVSAIHREVKAIGANQLVLPRQSRHRSLLNYIPIREVFGDAVDGLPETKISHSKPRLRSELEKFRSDFNLESEDLARMNASGILIPSHYSETSEVKLTTKSHSLPPFDPTRKVTPSDAIELALDLNRGGAMESLIRVLRAQRISETRFESLLKILENRKELPTDEYLRAADSALKRFGLDRRAIDSRPHLGYMGRLRASDALSPERQATSVETLILALRNGDSRLDASHYMNKHQEVLLKNSNFRNLLIRTFQNPEAMKRTDALVGYLRLPLPKDLNDALLQGFDRVRTTDHLSSIFGVAQFLSRRGKLDPAIVRALHIQLGSDNLDGVADIAHLLKEANQSIPIPAEKLDILLNRLAKGPDPDGAQSVLDIANDLGELGIRDERIAKGVALQLRSPSLRDLNDLFETLGSLENQPKMSEADLKPLVDVVLGVRNATTGAPKGTLLDGLPNSGVDLELAIPALDRHGAKNPELLALLLAEIEDTSGKERARLIDILKNLQSPSRAEIAASIQKATHHSGGQWTAEIERAFPGATAGSEQQVLDFLDCEERKDL